MQPEVNKDKPCLSGGLVLMLTYLYEYCWRQKKCRKNIQILLVINLIRQFDADFNAETRYVFALTAP